MDGAPGGLSGTAEEEADPYGMTARKATATATARAIQWSFASLQDDEIRGESRDAGLGPYGGVACGELLDEEVGFHGVVLVGG
jgi:hypothetical protein